MKEEDKLNMAVDSFVVEMKKKLQSKRRAGFKGWDEGSFNSFDIPVKLLVRAAKVVALGHQVPKVVLVDIANFCMMLHKKIVEWEKRNESIRVKTGRSASL